MQRQFVADAVRITPVEGPSEPVEPTPEPQPEPEPDMGTPDPTPDMGPDLPSTPDVVEEPVVTPEVGEETSAEVPQDEDPVTVNSGCGCTTADPVDLWGLLALLGLAVLARRRGTQ